MESKGAIDESIREGSGVRCADCKHFSFFHNQKGHNSPEALGKCLAKSWDGNRGQWPLLFHPCESFSKKAER